ncbi:MAG TPA: long-chain-fatty-acid--CoA ligase, partial [Sulfurovum sp.]|uniref:long-chain-fatty-acid--CoA ligase n=1 Tax=Sulfurovum sp. TaxID=1969726 RepID=UPI002F92C7F7
MQYKFNHFYELITYQAKKRGKKVALFVDDRKITYAEILEAADRLAGFLSDKGVQKGDKIALFLRNSPEFIYTIFAASKLGAVVVPVNTFLKEEELSYILEDSGSTVLVASSIYDKVVKSSHAGVLCRSIVWEGDHTAQGEQHYSFEEALAAEFAVEPVESSLEDTAVIIYTSGTTGKPKGAMLSHKNIFSNGQSGMMHIKVSPRDRGIVFLPMFHSFTFTIAVMLPMYVGMSIVIIQSIQPFSNIFKQTLLKRVTLFFGIPDVYNALAKAKLPWYFMWFNNIRAFISGASALQAKTLDAMAKKFKRARLLEGYGLSEASPAVCMNTLKKQKEGSVGTALYGYQIKIVDQELNEVHRGAIGDIIVKGDNVMQGYLNRPTATEETIINGWLLTGDVGYMDDEGFLFIVDRKKELIIAKGINIYPREIEDVIDRFDGIAASAVIGMHDEKHGEVPVAYVELDEGVSGLDEAALKQYMREHLANYKIPKQIHVIEALPKNATG